MQFSPLHELLDIDASNEKSSNAIPDIVDSVLNSSLRRWYHSREFIENIQNGQSYFNDVSSQSSPLRHSPSQLLQCHRKLYYRNQNAPKETEAPSGIFWTGEHVETDLVVPYLRDFTDNSIYVQNSMWVDFTIESDAGELQFKGETDPVFVDVNSIPLLLTEIKTKDSIKNLTSPSTHHLAQAHSYMYGLSEKYDRQITDTLLIYVARSTLNIEVFHEEFDPVFWRQSVLEWAALQSEFQFDRRLPPADPESGWECQLCSYRHRCGKETDGIGKDSPPRGFLPLREYPEEMVARHLEGHRDVGLNLTPTVAHQFPLLASKTGIYDWQCRSCGERFNWDTIEPEQPGEHLQCPSCEDNGYNERTVRGPTPEEQTSFTDE